MHMNLKYDDVIWSTKIFFPGSFLCRRCFQPSFICSNLTLETLKQFVKHGQSCQLSQWLRRGVFTDNWNRFHALSFGFHYWLDRQTDICLPNSGNRLYSETVKITAQMEKKNSKMNIEIQKLVHFQIFDYIFPSTNDPKQVRAMFQCLSQTF